MRIMVVGGLASSLINFRGPLLRAMVARGHDVIACAPEASKEVRTQLARMGVRYCHIPISRAGLNPLADVLTLLALLRLLRRERPDVLLAYTIKPVIWGCMAARLARIPASYAMITGLGYAFMGGGNAKQGLVQRLVCGLYRLALARTRAVFFQNPDDQGEFLQRGLIQAGTRTVLVNGSGVDVDHYARAVLPDKPVFLLMARLIADKGIREYRQAAALLRSRHPQARFLLAGNLDPNPAGIGADEVQEWRESGDIEYLGCLDDVRPALAKCLVYVLPSYYREGTPRSVLEAMAMGRPVITTDAPGCRETVGRRWDGGTVDRGVGESVNPSVGESVVRGQNGFLVPVRDVEALAGAMERFILEPELAERMGRESRRIAEEKYDVRKVNGVILEAMGI